MGQKNFGKKNFWFERFLEWNKFWVKKNLGWIFFGQKNFGKKILGQKKLSGKDFWGKKLGVTKNCWSKKCWGQKIFGQKKFSVKIFFESNWFGSDFFVLKKHVGLIKGGGYMIIIKGVPKKCPIAVVGFRNELMRIFASQNYLFF